MSLFGDDPQLKEDVKLLARVDDYAHGLSEAQKQMLEGWLRRVKDEKKALTEKQRKIAEEWDERYVE